MSLREGPGQVGNQSDFAHSAFLVEDRNYQHGDTFVQQDRSTAIYLYSGTDLHQYSTMRTPQNPSDDLIRLEMPTTQGSREVQTRQDMQHQSTTKS